MPRTSSFVFLILMGLLLAPEADAQLFQRRRARATEVPPNALLVMLPTARRKMEALRTSGDSTRLQQLRYDMAQIQQRMVSDFRDNFQFCPVYFFYDTASTSVRNGSFAGRLMDTALRPVEPAQYGVLHTDHLVAFFGYRARDVGSRQRGGDGAEYIDMADGDSGAMIQQLVLLDARMDQLVRPLPRTVANRYPGIKTFEKRPRFTYRYYAKHFDILYRPSAARADAVLENFYGSGRITGSVAMPAPAPGDGRPK